MSEQPNPRELEAERAIYEHFKRLGCFDPGQETKDLIETLAAIETRTPQATGKPAAGLDLAVKRKAWAHLKTSLGPEGWSTGDAFTYEQFFYHGWEALRVAALASPSPVTAAASAEASYQAWLKRAGYFDTPDLKEGYLAAYADASAVPVPASTDLGPDDIECEAQRLAEAARPDLAWSSLGALSRQYYRDLARRDRAAQPGSASTGTASTGAVEITKEANRLMDAVGQPGSASTGPALTVEKVRDTLHKAAPGSNELLAQCRDHALQPPSKIRLGTPGAAPKGREETV